MFALLVGFGALAGVSTLFGMMMALASELPRLEAPATRNSTLVDVRGKPLGHLIGPEKRVYVNEAKIAPVMEQAIIAIEDQRFYSNEGVDLRGIGRALWQDIVARRAVQGGSTITQQFVKNALAAQNERTVFNKLREAALAYHLTRQWSKQRILGNYLNSIYFGNGAYGIESAARTYFGRNHGGCRTDKERPCAAQLEPHEAALLAGVVASPSGFDPLQNPEASRDRRNIVLTKMLEQGYLTRAQYESAVVEVVPQRADVEPPREDTRFPYFTSWVKEQVVSRLGGGQEGARTAYEGGLTVKTTLDVALQDAAENAVESYLPSSAGPRAAMVVLDNATGEVRAMVSGDDYATSPFNLATQGQRQPGSAFKPFVLAAALESGISPESVWPSTKREFCLARRRGECIERFLVNNYEDAYGGARSLTSATTFSDNAVYAEVGLKVGIPKVARMARRLGVRTPVSRNPAITLGGLEQGVTPLDMAHSYLSFASGGNLVYGSLSPGVQNLAPRSEVPGPAAINSITDARGDVMKLDDGSKAVNRPRERRVLPQAVAGQVESMLRNVVRSGTAQRAYMGTKLAAGKTGTTENYGDAWFVGWTERYTAAVWVGYPDRLKPMLYEFAGEPVAGGTYPTLIWKAFMERAERIHAARNPKKELDNEPAASPAPPGDEPPPTAPVPADGAPDLDGGDGAAQPQDNAQQSA
ncbi:MAG: transglycosylase domain-containing protein, partial [Actinomycetota bacterium]|nr:transglycosylase domain-containing protein [Actinomycetota bacterium]